MGGKLSFLGQELHTQSKVQQVFQQGIEQGCGQGADL